MHKLDAHIARAIDRHHKHHPRMTISQILNSFTRIAKRLKKGMETVRQKRARH